jgi:hypothetical protein
MAPATVTLSVCVKVEPAVGAQLHEFIEGSGKAFVQRTDIALDDFHRHLGFAGTGQCADLLHLRDEGDEAELGFVERFLLGFVDRLVGVVVDLLDDFLDVVFDLLVQHGAFLGIGGGGAFVDDGNHREIRGAHVAGEQNGRQGIGRDLGDA